MWAARRADALKRAALSACPPDLRSNVRFGAPEARRNYTKVRGGFAPSRGLRSAPLNPRPR
jgi:hypothetical protein